MHFCLAFAILLIFCLIAAHCLRNSFLEYENECTKLSEKSLVVILGQAFNPRYMSIDPPVSSRKESAVFGYKRDSYELPFYVDTDMISVGDFPAWETNHLSYFEEKQQKRRRRQTHNVFERMTTGNTKSDMFKSRPWECSSKINWIDLGSHYFPRYIRSVECTTKKCWYGHFDCKPKSFGVKVLRRKPGSCIRVSDKLIVVTSEHYEKPFAELWTWQEIAIDFCCECVMIY